MISFNLNNNSLLEWILLSVDVRIYLEIQYFKYSLHSMSHLIYTDAITISSIRFQAWMTVYSTNVDKNCWAAFFEYTIYSYMRNK